MRSSSSFAVALSWTSFRLLDGARRQTSANAEKSNLLAKPSQNQQPVILQQRDIATYVGVSSIFISKSVAFALTTEGLCA
jgi:hypothetical protein